MYCTRGGTLTTGIKGRRGTFDDPDRQFGIESRSLKACYELIEVHRCTELAAAYENRSSVLDAVEMRTHVCVTRNFGEMISGA